MLQDYFQQKIEEWWVINSEKEPEQYLATNVPEMWMYNKEDKVVFTQEGSRGNQILRIAPNVKPVQE